MHGIEPFNVATKGNILRDEPSMARGITDSAGVAMNPNSYEGISNACIPSAAEELCKYIHAKAWMSILIPLSNEQHHFMMFLNQRAKRHAYG